MKRAHAKYLPEKCVNRTECQSKICELHSCRSFSVGLLLSAAGWLVSRATQPRLYTTRIRPYYEYGLCMVWCVHVMWTVRDIRLKRGARESEGKPRNNIRKRITTMTQFTCFRGPWWHIHRHNRRMHIILEMENKRRSWNRKGISRLLCIFDEVNKNNNEDDEGMPQFFTTFIL